MKIIYAAGPRKSSNTQLARIVPQLSLYHTLKTANYYPCSFPTDWDLSQVRLKKRYYQQDAYRIFLVDEIEKFEPDLIISDFDFIIPKIAISLKIPFWLCSPLYILDGVRWGRHSLKYLFSINAIRKYSKTYLDEAQRVLIYSPFGNLSQQPPTREGYEWITPYHLPVNNIVASNKTMAVIGNQERAPSLTPLLKNFVQETDIHLNPGSDDANYLHSLQNCSRGFTTGETGHLSDLFFSGKSIYLSPSVNDLETTTNASALGALGVGYDVAQIELQELYAELELKKILDKDTKEYFLQNNEVYLHQLLPNQGAP